MICIYCDEDVDVLIKALLEAKGFRVLTTQSEKMLGVSDIQQLNHAIKIGCVFLTHNRLDFEKLYTKVISEGINQPGVIIASKHNVYELARRVSKILSVFTKESIKNQLLYI